MSCFGNLGKHNSFVTRHHCTLSVVSTWPSRLDLSSYDSLCTRRGKWIALVFVSLSRVSLRRVWMRWHQDWAILSVLNQGLDSNVPVMIKSHFTSLSMSHHLLVMHFVITVKCIVIYHLITTAGSKVGDRSPVLLTNQTHWPKCWLPFIDPSTVPGATLFDGQGQLHRLLSELDWMICSCIL